MPDIVKIANDNEGFIGLLTFVLLSVLTPLAVVAYTRLSKRLSAARSSDEIQRIERIRSEFYTHLKVIDEPSAFGRFLIRDVVRDRLYFDGDEKEFSKRGAPPSFKVQLVDLSVHGVCVYHGWPERIKSFDDGSQWCLAESDDERGVTAHPIGIIPFSSIVAVNWHGDPATTFPHIYCDFDQTDGWPYKSFSYCEKQPCMRGWPLYIPLVDADRLIRKHF